MKAVKVDDEAYKILEELATKSNTSIKELVTKAVKLLYIGKEQENIAKTIVDMYQKFITVRPGSVCSKCGRQFNDEETAYYIKYTYNDNTSKSYVLCLDCYYSQYSDKAIVKVLLKKKQLEREIKALRNEKDELIKQVEALTQVHTIALKTADLSKIIEAIRRDIGNEELYRKAFNLVEEINNLKQTLFDIEFITNYIKKYSDRNKQQFRLKQRYT
jgi:hypothetical protein